MATTLASATLDLARILGDVVDSSATSAGTTATTVDSGFGKRDYSGTFPAADYYNYGTIWFIDCSTTPLEGTTRIITDFAASTACTFTYDTAAGATVANDTYAVCDAIWPRYKLRECVGLAVQSIMGVPSLDVTLTTSTDTETLNLPTGVYNVKHIQIATSLASPYYFEDFAQGYWEEKNGKIYFKPGRWPDSSGYAVRLWYQVPHLASSYITSDATTISSYIHPEWLAWEGAVHAYRWRKPRDESGKIDELKMKEAIAMAERLRRKYYPMIPHLGWNVKLANWNVGDASEDPTYSGYVRVRS